MRPDRRCQKSKRCWRSPALRHPRRDFCKNGGGMWPQCGAGNRLNGSLTANAGALPLGLTPGKNCPLFRRSTGRILAAKPLTIAVGEAYIRPLGAPPLPFGAMTRLAKPLTVYTVNHPAMSYGHVGCAGIGGSGACRRRGRKAPGCLTSESEERETWTAESLRAAFANGKPFASRP